MNKTQTTVCLNHLETQTHKKETQLSTPNCDQQLHTKHFFKHQQKSFFHAMSLTLSKSQLQVSKYRHLKFKEVFSNFQSW